jgi:hypothetical protein
MKVLAFVGYSDDTFSCQGPGIDVDRDTCASGAPVYMLVKGKGGALVVSGQYCPGPTHGWQIAVAPWDPDHRDDDTVHMPLWDIRITRSQRPYSPALTIVAPDDVTVELLDHLGRIEPSTPEARDKLVDELRNKVDDLAATITRMRDTFERISQFAAHAMKPTTLIR